MRDNFIRRMRDRGFIAIISFLFSVGLWYRVVGGEKVEATKSIKLDYKLPKDLSLFSNFPSEVVLKVSGPAPFVGEYQKQDVLVTLDLSKFGTGEHEIGFRSDQFKVPKVLDIISINPVSLKVFLDRELKKRVAVRPVFSTQLPEDYKVESVVVQPNTVEVSGSRVRLGVLASVPTELIYITENSLRQHFEVNLNMSDTGGVQVAEKISTVHVEINLKGPAKKKVIRAIPIKLRVGSPSKSRPIDTELRHIRLRPSKLDLTVEGPQAALDDLDSENIDVWAQLTDLRPGTKQVPLAWKLSPDIRILEKSADSVSVTVP